MRVKHSLVAVAATMTFITCALAQVPAEPPPPGAENLPERPGKAFVVQACGNCHRPDIVLGQKRDADAWRELVDQMVARGANVEEAQYEQIIAYLAQTS